MVTISALSIPEKPAMWAIPRLSPMTPTRNREFGFLPERIEGQEAMNTVGAHVLKNFRLFVMQ